MSAPNPIDLQTPFDPTAFTEITGAQLEQLVGGTSPAAGIGFIVVSVAAAPTTLFPNGVPNVPNAVTTPKWQSYMWVSVFNTFITAYLWNPNGATDATYLNWVTVSSASIGPGTIQGYQIAANTITSGNIVSISSTQITGSVVAGWLAQLNLAQTAYATNGLMNNNSLIFGVLNGTGSTVATPVFGANVIPSTAFIAQSIAGNATPVTSPIIDNSIQPLQLAKNTGNPAVLSTAGGVDPTINIAVPSKSLTGTPSSTNYNTLAVGHNVAPGDVLVVNYQANQQGFVTSTKSILSLSEPTSETYPQIPFIAANGIIYSIINPQGNSNFGRILQMYELKDNTVGTQSSVFCANTTLPTTTNCPVIASLTAALFTPLSATSTIFVEVGVFGCCTTIYDSFVIGLFQDATTNAIAASYAPTPNFTGGLSTAILRFNFASSPGLVAAGTTLKVGFSPDTSGKTAYYNSLNGSTKMFGGILGINSYIRITEYL
jgi:hypothetical protein